MQGADALCEELDGQAQQAGIAVEIALICKTETEKRIRLQKVVHLLLHVCSRHVLKGALEPSPMQGPRLVAVAQCSPAARTHTVAYMEVMTATQRHMEG